MAKSDGSVRIDTKIDTSGFGKGLADAKKRVSAFSSSLNKLGLTIRKTFSQSNTTVGGKGYEELRKEIAKTEVQLSKLIEKQIRFVETGGNIKSRAMAGMEYDIEMTRNRLEELRKQLALTSKETPKTVGKMQKWIERLRKSFESLNKTTKRGHYGILKMLGTSLLFSTVFRAISLVTKGFAEGINNLAQYSDSANATMSALMSSLTQLKNSFATAFMPIITAVTPAVTQFISLISKATSIVAAFFSALTGEKTYTKAIEVQEDYAASLDKTADSAKKAQKYLSGLDEIRTFTEKDNGVNGAVLPENMFTEEEIDSPILRFADKVKAVIEKIKDFIKKEDWKGLGAYISDGIVFALSFLGDKLSSFDWDGLGEDIGEFIKGIKWIDILQSVGGLIWDAINSGIDLWKGSFKTAPIETAILTALIGMKFAGLKLPLKVTLLLTVGAILFNFAVDAGKELARATLEWANNKHDLGFTQEWLDAYFGDLDIAETFMKVLGVLKKNPHFGAEAFVFLLFGKKIDIKRAMGSVNNEIINGLKRMVNIAVFILNTLIDAINDLASIEWSPVTAFGKQIVPGGSAKLFELPKIPYLASGAVIPPNAPFVAMLGDQRHGTNIEAPLDTIKQAVREVLGSSGGGKYAFTAQINRRTLFEEIIDEAKLRQSTSGRNPFDLA